MSAYKDGQQAFKDGKGLTTNPYSIMDNAPERELWSEGWNDASWSKDLDDEANAKRYRDLADDVAAEHAGERLMKAFGSPMGMDNAANEAVMSERDPMNLDNLYVDSDAPEAVAFRTNAMFPQDNPDQAIVDTEEEGKK